MKEKKLSELTDQQLLSEAKKMKSSPITNAVLIGLMIGVVVYGVAKSNIGFFALVLILFVGYKAYNNPKNNTNNKELEKLLKERNLS